MSGGEFRAAERLRAKRKANALIPVVKAPPSRQVKRRAALMWLKKKRGELKASYAKNDMGGAAAVTVDDVAEYIR